MSDVKVFWHNPKTEAYLLVTTDGAETGFTAAEARALRDALLVLDLGDKPTQRAEGPRDCAHGQRRCAACDWVGGLPYEAVLLGDRSRQS